MTRREFLNALNGLGEHQSFSVVINEGLTYDIEHPALVMVAKDKVAIGIGLHGNDPEDPWEEITQHSAADIELVPLDRIARLETRPSD
jgi:hypothetical protein